MVQFGPVCKLGWGKPVQAGVWSALVEVVLVETLDSEPAVEAFDKAVLHGLAWCDVVPFDSVVFLQLLDSV